MAKFYINSQLVYIPRYSDSPIKPPAISGDLITRNDIWEDARKRYSEIAPGSASYARQKKFNRFLKGKGKLSIANQRNNWVFNLGELPQYDWDGGGYEVRFLQKDKVCAAMRFANLSLWNLDDNGNVLLSYLMNAVYHYQYYLPEKSQQLSDNIHIPTYTPNPRRSHIENFTLIFEKKKSVPDLADVAPVQKLLQDSSFTIRRAKITAFASVEGQDSTNLRLQKERAKVLLRLLEQVNADAITPEIETAENWEMFFKQLRSDRYKNTPYQNWVNKSHEEIKELLKDEKHLRQLEPALAAQRRAELRLAVEEKMTPEKKQELLLEDFRQYQQEAESLRAGSKNYQKASERLAAIRAYVRRGMIEHTLSMSRDWCGEIFSYSNPLLDKIEFVMLTDSVAENEWISVGSQKLPCMDEVALVSRLWRQNIQDITFSYRRKDVTTLKQLVSEALFLQRWVFTRIHHRALPADLFCQLGYPDTRPFYSLSLNRIHYTLESENVAFMKLECDYSRGGKAENDVQSNTNSKKTLSLNSHHYKMMKEMVLSKDELLESELSEFDLFQFLDVNVWNWDFEKNILFDSTFTHEDMITQYKQLEKIKKNLPEYSFRNLCVILNMKLAGFYLRTDTTGSYQVRHDKAYAAMNTIVQYYSQKTGTYEADEVIDLSKAFLMLNTTMNDRRVVGMARDFLHPRSPGISSDFGGSKSGAAGCDRKTL